MPPPTCTTPTELDASLSPPATDAGAETVAVVDPAAGRVLRRIPVGVSAEDIEGVHALATSPDGRWIMYVSNESGRSDVYVQPYPGPGDKVRITPNGGNGVCRKKPTGDAGLNPPALKPRATAAYTMSSGRTRSAALICGETFEKLSSGVTRRPGAIAGVKNVPNWKDVSPRLGLSYDVFGNGATAAKFTISRYVINSTGVGGNPVNQVVNAATRTWTDLNGNLLPECDFLNPEPNAECGRLGNLNFGKPNITTTIDPDYLEGWGKREDNWETTVGVQHELFPRDSVEVGYNRRWWGNRAITINERLDRGLEDYDSFTVTVPSHENLPGTGNRYTYITIKPEAAARGTQNFQTLEKTLIGENPPWYWHGFDLTLNARMRNGLTFQGGTSTGRKSADSCDLRAVLPEQGRGTRGTTTSITSSCVMMPTIRRSSSTT